MGFVERLPCDRRRGQHPLGARHRGLEPLDQRARSAEGIALGQRPGVRLDAVAPVGER